MKIKIIGPRILVKVKKFDVSKSQTFANSSIVMPEAMLEAETTGQTVGQIVQLGTTAFKRKDAFCTGEEAEAKVGDIIHFSRYGAQRLNSIKTNDDAEYWVLMDKDIIAIEVTKDEL